MRILIGFPGNIEDNSSGSGIKPYLDNLTKALSDFDITIITPKELHVDISNNSSSNLIDQFKNTTTLAKEFATWIENHSNDSDIILVFSFMGRYISKPHVLVQTSLPYKKAIVSMKNEYSKDSFGKSLKDYYEFLAGEEYTIYANATSILTTSVSIAESMSTEYPEFSSKINTITHPIYVQKKAEIRQEDSSKMKIVVSPQELRTRKGIRYAIETMKRVKQIDKNIVLLILGKIYEPEKEYIKDLLTKAKGKANIILAGFLPKEKYYSYLHKAHAAFLPIVCEGQCEALTECISFEIPVITNEYTQYSEDVVKRIGYLAKYKDVEDYTKGIISLVQNKEENAKKREECKNIQKEFTFDTFKEELLHAISAFTKS